jgi:hypothetical protein
MKELELPNILLHSLIICCLLLFKKDSLHITVRGHCGVQLEQVPCRENNKWHLLPYILCTAIGKQDAY